MTITQSKTRAWMRCWKRKRGIPITLSLVYMEVAKMVGIDMIGVNLPGHFMIDRAMSRIARF